MFAYLASSVGQRATAAAPAGSGGGAITTDVWASVDPKLQAELAAGGVTPVYVTDSVVEADPSLKGVAAPRWGSTTCGTYDCVPGTFLESTKQVVIAVSGKYGNGSINMMMHEIGHALDFVLGGASNSAAFMSAWRTSAPGMGAYYSNNYGPNGVNYGPRETFAEGFAQYYGGNSKALGGYFANNPPY